MKISKKQIGLAVAGLVFSILIPLGCERTHWNGDPKDTLWIEPWGLWMSVAGWLVAAICAVAVIAEGDHNG